VLLGDAAGDGEAVAGLAGIESNEALEDPTDPTSVTVQVVRFYLPAIGAIARAWLVTRIPGRAWLRGLTSAVVISVLFGVGVWSFYAMYAAFGIRLR
jgi:hypothetical protein